MSSQESYLQASGYIFDTDSKIWIRSEYAGIAYSDGDETELRIAGIIGHASDITVFSSELRQQCTDWPSLYHLSGTRANILRPFTAALTGDILEIGAGCGAITRYLGESGANILALEGSPRRAAIVRSRTRDLENVTVLAEKFDQFQCDHRFDLITLVGVLEYANLFTSGENPARTMLQHVRSLLKPEGKLIIAIENQLGLKYFAGAPEDHLGQPMYGVEGRYRLDQPQTFGRTVLADLLEETKYATVEFLAPFPDYKLPVSILTEEGLSSKKFDGAALAWQSVRRDPQLPTSTSFSLELTWPEVFKNRLALDMANSFLIMASPLQQKVIRPGILGYHYSTDRVPQYCKETVFEHHDENTIVVNYRMLGAPCNYGPNQIINFGCPEKSIYAEGVPLSLEFVKIVTRDGWSIEEVADFIKRYVCLLGLIAAQKGHVVAMLQPHDKLPGDFFDVVPQNIIVNLEGQPIPIDTEWSVRGEIELGWLLFRSLLLAMASVVRFGKNSEEKVFSRRKFVNSALEAAGYYLTDKDFSRFIALESVIQEHVTGRTSQEFLNWWPEHSLPTCSVVGCEEQIAERDSQIANRDLQIAKLDQTLAGRDEQIINLNQALDQRDGQLQALYESRSWKISAPMRWAGHQAHRIIFLARALTLAKSHAGGTGALLKKSLLVFQREGLTGARRRLYFFGARGLTAGVEEGFQYRTRNRTKNKILPPHHQSVDIIVCVHNALEDVKYCLESVVANTRPPYRLIIVDDGSASETKDFLEEFIVGQPAKLIRNDLAFGYTRAANVGLRASKGDFVILLNSDTVVPPRWLDRLIQCAISDNQVGMVGPLSNTASWQSVPQIFNERGDWAENSFPSGWTAADYADEVARESQRIYPRVGFLNGFCLLIKRQVIGDIGFFDEKTFAQGYGEENDYCLRAVAEGWQLAVADDCYVFHAQSKSYSHARREQLSRLAGDALTAKHGVERIEAQVSATREHPALAYVRTRCEQISTLKERRDEITFRHEGKRILFLLPAGSAGGGGNIVLLECSTMRELGVDAWIANLEIHRELFERSHPGLELPILYLRSPEELPEYAIEFDAVVATLYITVFWLKPLLALERVPQLGYYIQDFEPDFFPKESAEYQLALSSYTAIPSIHLFTKTSWTRSALKNALGVAPEVIGPSLDSNLFHPAAITKSAREVIKIIAMIRPSTPRRAPEMTLQILKRVSQHYQQRVMISLFGVRSDDPGFLCLDHDFTHICLGELSTEQVAEALAESDIFLDCSSFQAMGLTAMEAMASGVAAIGPINGGLRELITDEETGLLVDTRDEQAIFLAIVRLIDDTALRKRIQLAGISAVKHSPVFTVHRMLNHLFASGPTGGTFANTRAEEVL